MSGLRCARRVQGCHEELTGVASHDSLGRGAEPPGVDSWAGIVLFGGTTGLTLLAVLSRHTEHNEFSSLSALLGLAFACSLIPAGLQMRCAALVADGQPVPRMARGWSGS